MATREELKQVFANGQMATGEKFANLIDSMKVVQLPVVDPQALGTSLSFIDSISQDADGKITVTKKRMSPTVGSFRFVANDATAEAAFTVVGTKYSGAISGVSPSADTLGVILLMNDDDTTPTKTMMITTEEVTPATNPATYQFVYVGDLSSALPSGVLTVADIVNGFTGGVNKVLSAEAGTALNEGKIDKQVKETSYSSVSSSSITDAYVSASGTTSSVAAKTYFFPVTLGKTYKISGRFGTSTSYYLYAFYNESTHVQSYQQFNTNDYSDYEKVDVEVTIPNSPTITHIAVSNYQGGAYMTSKATCNEKVITVVRDNQEIIDSVGDVSELETTEKETIVGAINEVRTDAENAVSKVDGITETVISPNMFDKSTMLDGYIASTAGRFYPDTVHKTSDFIEILPNHYYYLSGRSSNKVIRCLDANKTNTNPLKVLSVVGDGTRADYNLPNDDATDTAVNGMFKTPSDAKYVQFNAVFSTGDSADAVMLTDVGESYNSDYVVPQYQPYGPTPKTYIKQSAIDCDDTPTEDSEKPITSGGVYEALQNIELPTPTTKKGFKVLLAGSSHGRNTITQLPWIASKAGFEVVVGNIYYGACSMQNLLGKVNANTKLNFLVFDKEENEQTPSWHNKTGSYKFDEILQYTDWDFIILQRSAGDDEVWLSQAEIDQDFASYSEGLKKALDVSATPAITGGNYKEHNYALQSLLDIILANSGDRIPTILFNSSFADGTEYPTASAHLTTCENIMTTAEKMRKNFGLEIIPTCIALLNARTTYLNNYGCGMYHSICYDPQHLDIGIGCYIASLTVMQVILDKLGYNIEMLPNNAYGSYTETKTLYTELDYPLYRYTEPTPFNIKTAKACVLAAVNYPSARTTEVAARFTTDDREVWTITKTFNSTQVKLNNYQNFVDKGGNPYSNKVEGMNVSGSNPPIVYQIDSVMVTMGGVDITSTAYNNSTGEITIASVTGDIDITVTSE